MLRRILSVILGLVIAMIIIRGFEMINHRLYPFPSGMDTADQNQMAAFVKTLPAAAFIILLTGWAAGSFVCGMTIALISKSRSNTAPYLAGLALLTAGIVNIFMFDQPVWFTVIGIILFIPATLLGHALFRPKA